MHILNITASINKAVSCTCACLYTTYCWARAECLVDNVTGKTTAPKGPSPINLKWSWVHSSASWLTSTWDRGSLFNGNKSMRAGKRGSGVEGGLGSVAQHHPHLTDGALHWVSVPRATARGDLSRQHHLSSIDAKGATLRYVSWTRSLLLHCFC